MKKLELISKVKSVPGYVRSHWNTPNEGEYLSLKEIAAFTVAQGGTYMYLTLLSIVSFSSTYFCGAIMGIAAMDFYVIGLIGTVLDYAFILLNPFGVLIYENHGRLTGKTKIFANIAYCVLIVSGVVCFLLPKDSFSFIINGFPQFIGTKLLVTGFTSYFTWIVRRLFCAKHGRVKPLLLACGFPAAVLFSVIPFLPVENLDYTSKVILLNLVFSFANYFHGIFMDTNGLVTFITPNSQERQRLYSIVPIVTGFIPSVINIFLPILIQTTGGYLNIQTYRVFVPIFCFAGVICSLAVVKCKERVIEPPLEKRARVTFFKGAKKVLSNKYFWISNISSTLGQWQWLVDGLLTWWFVYSLRMEWFSGIAASIVVVGMTVGNIACPILTGKFQKRDILIISRAVMVFTIFGVVIAVKTESIVIFMASMILKNTVKPVIDGVNAGMNADVQMYHQWKYGERADSMSGIFSWFLRPVTLGIGYVMPYLLKINGFTSDWDVLYDGSILNKVFTLYTWGTIIALVIMTIPYIFYDLTKEKYEICVRELQERMKEINGEEASEESDAPLPEEDKAEADEAEAQAVSAAVPESTEN